MRPVNLGSTSLRWAVVIACLAAAATGCSSSSDSSTDNSVSTSAESKPLYPDWLSADGKAGITLRDSIRPTDPCGFLDPTALHAIGTPDYIGANGEFTTCTAHFSPPVGDNRIVEASIRLAGAPEDYGQSNMVSGVDIRTSNTPDFCTAYLARNPRQTLAFAVTTKGDLMGTGPKVDLCPEALSLAAPEIAHIGDKPLRSRSTFQNMNTRLATLDPCRVLEQLSRGQSALYVNSGANPWECMFSFDPSDPKAGQSITYMYASDAKLTRSPGNSKQTVTTINGYPALIEKNAGGYGSTGCIIHIATDPSWTPRPLGSPDRSVEMIEISVEGGGCDRAQPIAEEITQLYRSLPN